MGGGVGAAVDDARGVGPRGSPTGDDQCLAGAATTEEPGALLRGGFFLPSGASAGPLRVRGLDGPSFSSVAVGFGCAR